MQCTTKFSESLCVLRISYAGLRDILLAYMNFKYDLYRIQVCIYILKEQDTTGISPWMGDSGQRIRVVDLY